MSLFGWSYPPGCESVPGDEEYPCEVCGLGVDDCICPECPKCGEVGAPDCYESGGCGLVRTAEQIAAYEAASAAERAAAEGEAAAERAALRDDVPDPWEMLEDEQARERER